MVSIKYVITSVRKVTNIGNILLLCIYDLCENMCSSCLATSKSFGLGHSGSSLSAVGSSAHGNGVFHSDTQLSEAGGGFLINIASYLHLLSGAGHHANPTLPCSC